VVQCVKYVHNDRIVHSGIHSPFYVLFTKCEGELSDRVSTTNFGQNIANDRSNPLINDSF
jgi:hypothetical protein